MLQQIVDFREEAEALSHVLQPLAEADWGLTTQFKGWTINDVIVHLHAGDLLAAASVKDPAAFGTMLADIRTKRASGLSSIAETTSVVRAK